MKKIGVTLVVVAALLFTLLPEAIAATVWTKCATDDDEGFAAIGVGTTLANARKASQVLGERRFDKWRGGGCNKIICECSQPGWFANVRPKPLELDSDGRRIGRQQKGGVSCGYDSREAAVQRAIEECRKNGPNCDTGTIYSAYDSGKQDVNLNDPNTIGWCGEQVENCF